MITEKKRKTYSKIDRTSLIHLVLKIAEHKEDIQRSFDNGKIRTISEFAKLYGIPPSSASKILKEVGINPPSAHGVKRGYPTYQSILIVLERICKNLDINYDEIKQYL